MIKIKFLIFKFVDCTKTLHFELILALTYDPNRIILDNPKWILN